MPIASAKAVITGNHAVPIVNVYGSQQNLMLVGAISTDLRTCVATALTTKEIILTQDHISVRLIPCGGAMIGNIEFEIHAHCYRDRVQCADQISTSIRTFLEDLVQDAVIRVWLILSEVGYAYNKAQSSQSPDVEIARRSTAEGSGDIP